MVAFRVVRGVTDHFTARYPEWIFAFILFMFGWKLLDASDTFHSSPSYAVMSQFASENTWGWAIVSIAGARLLALALNGTFAPFARWSPLVRMGANTLSCGAWFAIALGVHLANPAGTGHWTYYGLMVGDIVNGLLVAGDAGAMERRLRHDRGR